MQIKVFLDEIRVTDRLRDRFVRSIMAVRELEANASDTDRGVYDACETILAYLEGHGADPWLKYVPVNLSWVIDRVQRDWDRSLLDGDSDFLRALACKYW